MCVTVKTKRFYSFTNLSFKKTHAVIETFNKKNCHETFHCGFVQLKVLEIFTTACLLKTII